MDNNEALARQWGQSKEDTDATIKSRQWQWQWRVAQWALAFNGSDKQWHLTVAAMDNSEVAARQGRQRQLQELSGILQ